MVNLIIPHRILNNPLWILLSVGDFLLYIFTVDVLVPHCKRLIRHPCPSNSAHSHHEPRQRSKIYTLISTVGVSLIVTESVGLVGILYCVSAAKQTSSTGLGIFFACVAALCGGMWMCTALWSLVNVVYLVRMAREHSGAGPRAIVASSAVLGEKEKGIVAVRDVECAA